MVRHEKIKLGFAGTPEVAFAHFKHLFNDPNKPPVISALNITTHLGGIIDSTASGAL